MAYNQISFLGWSWILVLAIKELVENDFDYTGVFNAVWKYLPAVQTAAALEVSTFHSKHRYPHEIDRRTHVLPIVVIDYPCCCRLGLGTIEW